MFFSGNLFTRHYEVRAHLKRVYLTLALFVGLSALGVYLQMLTGIPVVRLAFFTQPLSPF